MKSLSCFVFFVLMMIALQAQRFGGNAPSVKWQQVDNDAARVIFPKGMDTSASRIAAIVEKLSKTTLPTIGSRQNIIDIILHPYTTESNGYVALGPFRSEFYLTPAQNSFELGSLRWQDMLAIHEYRHVEQYNNFNVGLSHVFRILFGEEGQEFANSLSIPNWFWEGDAVYQETLVSEQGRGRLPFFFDDYRSLWLAGKDYSYMKLRNGSLKDFTPDHYRLGYMMVSYGREKYGDDFWKQVTHDAASFKGLFYPFQRAVKQYSGKTFGAFTQDALDYFKKQSAEEQTVPEKHRHFIADQEFPAYTDTSTIVYVKTTYKNVPAFIEKYNDGNERTIRVRDVSLDNQFSYRNGKIVYASYRPAIRWAWNDYSELQVLDVASGLQKTITRKSKYFSPDISEDGKTIVAVDVQPGKQSVLHLLNAETGELIKALPNPDNLFYTYPKFINEKQVIAAVRKPSGQMALQLINTDEGSAEYLTEASYHVMGNPVVQHDTIYFSAADKGYDRLFAYSLNEKKLFQLSFPLKGIGAYEPCVTDNKITVTSFTADGYQLQEINKNEPVWNAVSTTQWTVPISSFNIDLNKNAGSGLLSTVPHKEFPVQKYRQTVRLFNFHSLVPYINDPDYMLSIVGQNVLYTMQSEIFVDYNRNEQYKQVGADATFGGLFPYIDAGANYIFNRREFIGIGKAVNWNEGQANIGLSVPLTLSKGRSVAGLTIGADYVLKTISFTGLYKDSFNNTSLGYISSYLSFVNQIQQARQNIYPRLAQSIFISYRNAVQTVSAYQFLAEGTFYFPGFSINHNIVINLAFQTRDTLNQYSYSNSFPFSRGYEVPNLRNMYKFGANYHLPLVYPDFGIANIVFFQRVRANAFYDYTKAIVSYSNGYRINTPFRSAGAEIFFDTKWWNELPLNFGFRYSHLLDRDLYGGLGSERFEFILPINLFQQ